MQSITEKMIGTKKFAPTKELAKNKGEAPGIDISFDHIGETPGTNSLRF